MTIEERSDKYITDKETIIKANLIRGNQLINYQRYDVQQAYEDGAAEQKAIDDARINHLLMFLEALEAHYHDLNQYDNGKPIRRVISHIKTTEELI